MAEDELGYEGPLAAPAPGPLARLIRAEDGRRALYRGVREYDGARATGPFVLALAGAAAFAGALALDWATVEVQLPVNSNSQATTARIVELATGALFQISGAGTSAVVTFTTSNNLTSVELLGLLFGLGGLVLLTLAGAVLSRPELALRYRLAASGLGFGLLAVVGAGLARLPTLLTAASQTAQFSTATGEHHVSYQPGIICAALAVVFPLAAIWLRSWRLGLASEPVDRADDRADDAADEADPVVAPVPRRRPAEPYDLSVTPEP